MTSDACVFVFFSCRVLTELVSKMRDMQMDKTELGCLRAIVLFNPGNKQHPRSRREVTRGGGGALALTRAEERASSFFLPPRSI